MLPFALAALMLTTPAAPAALAAPVITGFACDSAGATVSCYVTYVGGAPPVSIRWTWNGLLRSAWDDRTSVSGGCQVGFAVQIGVRVFDSIGDGDGRATSSPCRRGNP